MRRELFLCNTSTLEEEFDKNKDCWILIEMKDDELKNIINIDDFMSWETCERIQDIYLENNLASHHILNILN